MGQFVARFDHVAPDAGQHESIERPRLPDGHSKQGHRSERESDRVDGSVARGIDDGVGDTSREVRVGLGIMGFGGRTVSEKVDPDHCAARLREEIDQTGRLPGRFVGTSPTVYQNDGTVHHASQTTP